MKKRWYTISFDVRSCFFFQVHRWKGRLQRDLLACTSTHSWSMVGNSILLRQIACCSNSEKIFVFRKFFWFVVYIGLTFFEYMTKFFRCLFKLLYLQMIVYALLEQTRLNKASRHPVSYISPINMLSWSKTILFNMKITNT